MSVNNNYAEALDLTIDDTELENNIDLDGENEIPHILKSALVKSVINDKIYVNFNESTDNHQKLNDSLKVVGKNALDIHNGIASPIGKNMNDLTELTSIKLKIGINTDVVEESEVTNYVTDAVSNANSPCDFRHIWDTTTPASDQSNVEIPKSSTTELNNNVFREIETVTDNNNTKANTCSHNDEDNSNTRGAPVIQNSSTESRKSKNFELLIDNGAESHSIEYTDCHRKSLNNEKCIGHSDAHDKGVEFVRTLEIESHNIELKLSQFSVGDVDSVVWDAGIALGKYLDYSQKSKNCIMAGKSAIDIGSGTGIVGLCAAVLGANVILTDLPSVIPQIEKNIAFNRDVLTGSASAMALSWGEVTETLRSFDIIFVSDCIYYDLSITKLIPSLVHLSSENTDIFISYEDRPDKKSVLDEFLVELTKYFTIDWITEMEQHPDYQSEDIHLLKCKSIKKQKT